ncbi:hypothetical protein L3Q82_004442 [Scortum barcoo]|uniref:Uncharacterized protein n=1 Tax=Scortum barcoo TaxID=214431 RepID=A0ACB8VK46_9TELE|nr:hypothetical protein L3Q82_004442 [Scortum barcoo]
MDYKKEKVRLFFELRDSPGLSIRDANIQVRTRRKWNVAQAVDMATERLKHQEIVGFTQPGRTGLRWGAPLTTSPPPSLQLQGSTGTGQIQMAA